MVFGSMSRFRLVAFSAIVGTVLSLGFQPDHWWLAILGLAGFLRLLDHSSVRQRLIVAVVVPSVWFAFHVSWMISIGIDAWIMLVIICMLPWLLMVFCPPPLFGWRAFTFPIGFVFVIEWIHSNLPWGGFPWGVLAFSQVDGPLVGLSRLGGQELVSATVVVCAVLVRQICARGRRRAAITSFALLSLLVVVLNSPKLEPSGNTRVAVIQGSVPTDSANLETQQRRVFENHLIITAKLINDINSGEQKRPELVLWPENATDLDPINNKDAHKQIQRVVDELNAPLLVGGVTWQNNPYGPRNAGLLWLPKTGPTRIYAKTHLVPFGEYIPMRHLVMSRIGRLSQIPVDFVPGDTSGVFELGDYKFGDVICFEVAYQDHLQNLVNEGANFFTVQTNNATYIHRGQAQQQFTIARFRAIEHTRSTVVASTTGISGIIDSNGQALSISTEGEAKYLVADIALYESKNFTDRHPNWLPRLFCLFALGLVLFAVAPKMRVRSRPKTLPQ